MSSIARRSSRAIRGVVRLLAVGVALAGLRAGPLLANDDIAAWAVAARANLRAPTAAEIDATRLAAQTELATVRQQLAELPVGGAYERELQLERLHALLDGEAPDESAIRQAVAAMRGKRPGEIHDSIVRLREATERFANEIGSSEATLARAERAIAFFALPDAELAAAPPDEVRGAFADLARVRRLDSDVEALRSRASHPNVYIRASGEYLLAVARREFEVPVSFRRKVKELDLAIRGKIALRTELELIPNDERAELQITVRGTGDLQLSGRRKRISLCADARPCARAAHAFAFGPPGVEVGAFDLDVTNRMSISSVCVDAAMGGRLAAGVLRRVLEKRLPEIDAKTASDVETQARARIVDECADIAFRMNGLFDEQLAARLAGRDIEARPRYASSAEGIRFDARYARRDQLAALAPRPTPIVARLANADFSMWLHESAIDNLASGLANAQLDESLYWMLLGEELKLDGDRRVDEPAARTPAMLVLAANDPLRIHFDDGQIEVVLRVQCFALDGVSQAHQAVVRINYRVAAGANGLRLERVGDIEAAPAAADPTSFAAVLARFFPPELRPKRRMRNNSFSQWMAIQSVVVDEGWLALGIGRQAESTSAKSHEVLP